jgi:hypothetical protein
MNINVNKSMIFLPFERKDYINLFTNMFNFLFKVCVKGLNILLPLGSN